MREGIPEDQRAFVEKVKHASRGFFIRGLFSSPYSPSYPTNARIIGELWGLVRKDLGITFEEVRTHAGIDEDDLILFESGLLDPKDYSPGFIAALGGALGRPDLVEFHKRFFGLEHEQPEQNLLTS